MRSHLDSWSTQRRICGFAAVAASAPSEEGAVAPKGFGGATEGEIPRACCLPRGVDEHQMKRRSFAFAVDYIYCFRTYSVYLSLRLPAQIPYAGIHLCPLAVLRSCFGYSLSHLRTAAACLSRCIRHRRRSKAKPLRGRRGRSRAVHRFTAVRPTFSLFTLTFYLRRQPHWGSQEPRLVTPLQVLTKKRAGKTCALLFVLCSFYESTFALRSG